MLVIGYLRLEEFNIVLIMVIVIKIGLQDIVELVKEINGLKRRFKSLKGRWRVIINSLQIKNMEGRIYKFIQIVDVSDAFPKKKTQTFQVRNMEYDVDLGWIKWHSGWRCYSFFPNPDTFYEVVCLENITEFLDKLKSERKEQVELKSKSEDSMK